MNNEYTNFSHPENAEAVTPNDSTDLTKPSILYVGVGGDVTVDMSGEGTNITFTAVTAGFLPVEVTRVYSTGTTATNIVALY